MFADSDLPVFFADFGVPVVWKGQTALGLLDRAVDLFEHGTTPGGFQGGRILLRIPVNAFNGVPLPRDPITVDGNSYTVQEQPPQQDAQILEFYLKLA